MSSSSAKKILTVVGTRPNFVKISQLHHAARCRGFDYRLCHTGQHFDAKMSDVFFQELEIPTPDYHLGIKAGSTVGQFAQIMTGLERVIEEFRPEVLLVPGDVNSTFAAAFTGHKMGVRVAHIESGLRSRDRSMPEEINRILTDAISDLFFVTEESGRQNLIREGADPAAIHFVGNTMIDTLLAFRPKISASSICSELGLGTDKYTLLTMHRPATVDHKAGLQDLLTLVKLMTARMRVVFAIHPRTRKNLATFGLLRAFETLPGLLLMEPVGYFAFQHLTQHAAVVVTDSGGVQEETTFYRVPCLTLRPNTERPSTVEIGSNTLFDIRSRNLNDFVRLFDSVGKGTYRQGAVPPLWDGKASDAFLMCSVFWRIEAPLYYAPDRDFRQGFGAHGAIACPGARSRQRAGSHSLRRRQCRHRTCCGKPRPDWLAGQDPCPP